MDGSRISEVAALTGFSASALRYYDEMGLVRPTRSEGGYRLYDDRTIERLRFVGRAKQLGLPLEDISELVALWDGDRCAPVADRLRSAVIDKVADTQRQIAALTEFAAQLERALSGLEEVETAGACSPECACLHAPEDEVSNGEAAPVIACTLGPEQVTSRVAEWRALVSRAVERQPVAGGRRLRFEPGAELAIEVSRLAAAEQACCSFFEFTVRLGVDSTDLEVRAPAEAMALVDALVGATT